MLHVNENALGDRSLRKLGWNRWLLCYDSTAVRLRCDCRWTRSRSQIATVVWELHVVEWKV